MKRIILTILILWGMTFGAFAQFGNREGGVTYVPVVLPGHALLDDQDASIGTVTQTISGAAGEWTGFSLYIEVEDPMDMLDLIKAQLGDYAVIIEGDEGYTEYEGGGSWFGDLDDYGVTNAQSYVILAGDDDFTFELEGTPVNTADYTITIQPGWNRIGFPCTEEVEITVALADFDSEEGDILEGPEGYTEYEGGGSWFGDIETMIPGQGYLYYSNSTETKYLVINIGAKNKRSIP